MEKTHHTPNRKDKRILPFGTITDVTYDGQPYIMRGTSKQPSGTTATQLFEDFFEHQERESAVRILVDLCEEIVVLRKFARNVMRSEGFRLTSPQEYTRGIHSLAQKLQEHPDDVRALIEPMLKEVVDDMFVALPSKRAKRHEKRHAPNPQQ